MTKDQKAHCEALTARFQKLFTEKYAKGAEEHKGNLWQLSHLELIDSAIEEVLDQFAYLQTLRDKILKRV